MNYIGENNNNLSKVRKSVVVLGMGRSGTSLVAGILEILGVNMGDSLKQASKSNPKGYFEDLDFVHLMEEIFQNAKKGGNYWNPPTHEEILAQRDKFDDRIRRLVSKKQSENQIWGWKMPWTNLTIELFLPYLSNPNFVIVFRNPIGNAHSFVEHNKILSLFESLKLINFYNKEILEFLERHPNLPKIFISFEKILSNPNTEARSLANFLGLDLSKVKIKKVNNLIIPRNKIKWKKRRIRLIKTFIGRFKKAFLIYRR
jgi:hypothetical protein